MLKTDLFPGLPQLLSQLTALHLAWERFIPTCTSGYHKLPKQEKQETWNPLCHSMLGSTHENQMSATVCHLRLPQVGGFKIIQRSGFPIQKLQGAPQALETALNTLLVNDSDSLPTLKYTSCKWIYNHRYSYGGYIPTCEDCHP